MDGLSSPPMASMDAPSPVPSSIPSNRSSVRSSHRIPPEWESSPMFASLSSRLSQTENALTSLSTQVAQLAQLVRASLPQQPLQTLPPKNLQHPTPTQLPFSQGYQPYNLSSFNGRSPLHSSQTQTFSPFGPPEPTQPPAIPLHQPHPMQISPFGDIPAANDGAHLRPPIDRSPSNETITTLTQQLSALSTSVAQLQRLQQNQAQLSRQNSYTTQSSTATAVPTDRPNLIAKNSFSQRIQHPQARALISGPLTTPSARSSLPVSPGPGAVGAGLPRSPGVGGIGLGQPGGPPANGGVDGRDFSPNRPQVPRSFSTSIVPGGKDETWGPPSFSLNPIRDWSPGPGLVNGSASLGGSGTLTPGGSSIFGTGVSANPGVSGGPNSSSGPTGTFGGINGVGTPAVVGANGIGTPGPGVLITKWDQLGLKVELLRSISKYGIGPPNKIQARVLPFMLKGSDVIAQAPPTQERIISYVVPALQLCLTLPPSAGPYRGPSVVIITTTVDQATQCHKLLRNVGGPLGIRSALATGVAGSSSLANEIAVMQRDAANVIAGTPAKINEVFTSRGGLPGSEVKLLILDEVDQLIARNLYENVLAVTRVFPSPRRAIGSMTPGSALTAPVFSPGSALGAVSPYDAGMNSPFNPASKTPFPGEVGGIRGSWIGSLSNGTANGSVVERQTCFFSNTIPTDVINFSQSLQVRDPVRVLVRRDGGPNSQESVSSVTPGVNVKHTYVYLTITGSAGRVDSSSQMDADGVGAIGSGRAVGANGQLSEEATRAREYKLDTLVKILDDYPLWQAIIHVGTFSMLEAVVFKLNSRQWETLYLSPDMPPPSKKAVLQQWRLSMAGNGPRFLVVFDVAIKQPEIPWSPLVINFDLPRSVEGYAQRAAAAVPPNNRGPMGQQSVHGVIVSFVQAAGGDVEMLRSTECAYRFKSAEIPSVFHDLFQH